MYKVTPLNKSWKPRLNRGTDLGGQLDKVDPSGDKSCIISVYTTVLRKRFRQTLLDCLHIRILMNLATSPAGDNLKDNFQ